MGEVNFTCIKTEDMVADILTGAQKYLRNPRAGWQRRQGMGSVEGGRRRRGRNAHILVPMQVVV
jgi:hypothetical protein